MSKQNIQKIGVMVDFSINDNILITSGLKISSSFNTELCLIYYPGNKIPDSDAEQKLEQALQKLNKQVPGIQASYLIPNGSKHEIAALLADDYEIILVIVNIEHYRYYSAAVTHSPIPFLFINTHQINTSFKSIVLPVDLRKGISDAAMWGSYFGRYINSEITVIAANQNGKTEQKEVDKNVIRIKKLMHKFNIKHKIYRGTKSSLRNPFEALSFAISSKSDMLILLGSSTITLADLVIGLPEQKIIKNAGNLSVLLVNSRLDNYILCD